MRRVIYLCTVSADGFVVDAEGKTDWIVGVPRVDYGFSEFYETISDIVMGSHTYEQIIENSSDDFFPYADKRVTVFTQRDLMVRGPHTSLCSDDPLKVVARQKLADSPGDIWLAGGPQTAAPLIAGGLVDEIRLFSLPIALGNGRSWLDGFKGKELLKFDTVHEWPGGTLEIRYLPVSSRTSK